MSWLKLTLDGLYLMEGENFTEKLEVTKDGNTLSLDVPLEWLRKDDAPRQMIVSLEAVQPPNKRTTTQTTWTKFYTGLELNGSRIPRKGLGNPTLEGTEPFGNVVQFAGLDFVKGSTSWFGGEDDDGVTLDETGTLTGEILRKLSKDDYYCAMRWSYSPNGRRFWANQRILVINPINQKAVIVRAIDWGPNTTTERIIDLSPKALKDLGADTDDDVLCAFAQPNSQPVGLI